MMLQALVGRMLSVLLPRAVGVMFGVGTMAGYGSRVIDLRGQLPVSATKHYATRPLDQVQGAVWHHTATKGQSFHTIAEYHVAVKGWPAIAYTYGINWEGVTYILNDATTTTYQSKGYNAHTIGLVLVGNYEDRPMTDAMKSAAMRLQDYVSDEYGLKYVWLHCDARRTLCPGKYAVRFLRHLQYGPKPPEKY